MTTTNTNMTTTNTNMTTTNTNTIASPTIDTNESRRDLTRIIKNIESNVNPKTVTEGLKLLDKPDELVRRMQSGANQFTEQTGRLMTYSEMRQMYG
jgi:hypothetical protein